MLTLIIGDEYFDDNTQKFEIVPDAQLLLEHSLLSVSKWESKTRKPFLSNDEKSFEEILLYVQAMIISPNYDPIVVDRLSDDNVKAVNAYIESPESATTFRDMPRTPSRSQVEIITSELIYYWMVMFTIPFEAETWHLNRLLTLIRICNVKNSKPTKMTPQQIAARNHALNEQRKAEFNTSG
jgi:hypothetical protein